MSEELEQAVRLLQDVGLRVRRVIGPTTLVVEVPPARPVLSRYEMWLLQRREWPDLPRPE